MGEKGNVVSGDWPKPPADMLKSELEEWGKAQNELMASLAQEAERPRTQEKPGTGAKDPKRLEPERPRERASGQITDDEGNYGPTRYSDPDTPNDRNRI